MLGSCGDSGGRSFSSSRDVHSLSAEAILLLKPRNEVLLSNLDLFNGKVGRDMDDLNTIEERLEHVCGGVRCADEDTFGEVELNIEVVISKCVGLLGVEELQEGCRNIAL